MDSLLEYTCNNKSFNEAYLKGSIDGKIFSWDEEF
jgi:hypothetical protein